MTPTIFGALVVAISLLMFFWAGPKGLLVNALYWSLLGGSAALIMSSLGGSSVAPVFLAIGFLFLKCVMPGQGRSTLLSRALRDQSYLIAFVIYAVVSAFLMPRLFNNYMYVTSLKPTPNHYIYAVSPLQFSSQNITVSVYMLATLLAAICGQMAASLPGGDKSVVSAACKIAMIHAFLGISGVLLGSTAYGSFLQFFRNGNYAQLNQEFEGLVRMNGIWPEPAAYATYGFSWLVFVAELWLRDVRPRLTGLAAAVLAAALLASTSTTAYIGIGAYSIMLAARLIGDIHRIPVAKIFILFLATLAVISAVLTLFVARPDMAEKASRTVSRILFDKAKSESGLQRAFWAKQGIDVFFKSYGLGIGAGSFRSSSIITAIIGSMGVFGFVTFVGQISRVFQPFRRSTYRLGGGGRHAVGVAAAWASFVPLIPACLAAASPDPGFIWGFFCGIALALRNSRVADNVTRVGPLKRSFRTEIT